MIVEEVATRPDLERLWPEWSRLWAQAPGATPFQSPEWLVPWWRHVGRGELWALALREPMAGPGRGGGGRLVGLAPLYVQTDPASGRRSVLPVGIATTDYLDALFAPGAAARGAAAVLAHLDAHRGRWGACDLQQLRPGSPLLGAGHPAGWSQAVSGGEPCPVLTLPASAERIPECLSPRLVQNIRYSRRRAERAGRLAYETADARNLEELFDALVRLNAARWAARGRPGAFADEAVRRAHRESLPRLLALGVLRLYALRLDGRIIAASYGLADPPAAGGRRHYYYVPGFDPAWDKLSPGSLLLLHAVERAVREGAAAFDFLRGREAYKYAWGARDRPTYRRRLWHPDSPDRPDRPATGFAPAAYA